MGSGYNKSDTLTGNLVTDEDFDPGNSRSFYRNAERDQSYHECVPEGIKWDIDFARAEFRALEAGMKASFQLHDGGA